MDAAGHHAADQDPESARHITELGGDDRAKQRTGRGDGRKVVSEQDVFVGLDVVVTVVDGFGGCCTVFAQVHDLVGQVQAVDPVRDGEDTRRREDHG